MFLIGSVVQETENMRQINSSDFRLHQSESSTKEYQVPCLCSALLIRPVLPSSYGLRLPARPAEVTIETIELSHSI